MPWFNVFDARMGRFYHHVGTVVGVSIGLFAVTIALDWLLRLLKLNNLPGLQELIEYMLFAGVFLAAPWVLRLGAHIRVDILVNALPQRLMMALERLLDVLGVIICSTLTWYGIKNLLQAYKFDSVQRKYFNVDEWWLLTMFVICFALLTVEFVSRLIRSGAAPEANQSSDGGV